MMEPYDHVESDHEIGAPQYTPGNVFNFTVHDGAEDRVLMATELLNLRIKETMDARERGGDSAEKSPVTYMKIGEEYRNIRRPGTMCFGQEVTVRIDPYGNFEHKMPAVRVSIPAVRVVPDSGGPPVDTCRYQPGDGQTRFEHDEK